AHDAVDDRQQMRVVAEARRHARELSLSFDVDALRSVHENVRDRPIAEQRFDRSEAGHLVDDLLDDLLTLDLAQRGGLDAQELDDRVPDLLNEDRLFLDLLERLEPETVD